VAAPNPPGFRTNVLNYTVSTSPWYQLQTRQKLVQPGIAHGDNPFAYHTDILNFTSVTQFPYQQKQNKLVQPGPDNPPHGLLVTVFEPWVEPPAFQQPQSKVVQPGVVAPGVNPPSLRTNIVNYTVSTWPWYQQKQNKIVQPFIPGDNPPFVNVGRWKQTVTVRSSWDPPDPQPFQRGPLNPSFLNVNIDNPPFRYPGRWPHFNSIIASWQPPDPQPTQRGPLPPFFLNVNIDNPPFRSMGRWVQFITITSSWEPPLAYQPTLPPKSTPPSGPPAPPVTQGQFAVPAEGVPDRFR